MRKLTPSQETAAALINTKSMPPGLQTLRASAAEAWAYHRGDPYPLYHFRNWMTEDRGPLPRCLPLAKSIVRRSARFLFGKPFRLTCAENEAWEAFLRKAWDDNQMNSRLVAMAEKAAIETGIVIKFAYDEEAETPLTFQTLSIADQVRLYADPHDRTKVLMARVQYSYFDAAQGRTLWYREEWTADQEIHYLPLDLGDFSDLTISKFNPDTCEKWIVSTRQKNPFGVIPLVYIKNIETDDFYGRLELDDLYRVLDNIHLTYHLMNRSNQFDAETNPIFIDADLDKLDIDKPLQPGQPIDLQTKEDAKNQAKVSFPDGGNALRPAMIEYAKDLRQQVMAAAGSVEINQADVSHIGNLTNAVLAQMYLPQIETTDEKRKSWGDSGLTLFFSLIARGLAAAGVSGLGIDPKNPDTFTVAIQWPPYFPLSEEEMTAKVTRLQLEEEAGYLPHENAVEEVTEMEGRDDIGAILAELKKEKAQKAADAETERRNAMETVPPLSPQAPAPVVPAAAN